jgi:hypothetical protein
MSLVKEKNFISQFCTSFELYSYNNKKYGQLAAHVLLGQILKNIKVYYGSFYIDPRVSLFLMQPSATGKSVVWDFIKGVGEKVSLRIDDIDEATDAGLVGSEEPEEVLDPETKTKTIVHNIVKGKLADNDILHYDEGKMLMNRGQYSSNTLSWFQKALNPIGTGQNVCKKNLAHSEIEIKPTCSLLITSHEIDNVLESILNTGFFQRIVFYPRYIPVDERKQNEMLRQDRFGIQFENSIDAEVLGEMLFQIIKETTDYKLVVDPAVYPVAKQYIDGRYKLINQTNERVKEIMATFIPRYDNLMDVFALHHSVVNHKTKIDVEDIKYGGSLSHELFQEVMTWVEENITLAKLNVKEKAYFDRLYQMWNSMEKDEYGYVNKLSLMKKFMEKWKLSYPAQARYIEKFIGYGKIKQRMVNNTVQMIKIEI